MFTCMNACMYVCKYGLESICVCTPYEYYYRQHVTLLSVVEIYSACTIPSGTLCTRYLRTNTAAAVITLTGTIARVF